MRLVFFTLLLANAVVFAYFHFAAVGSGASAARMPIAPERIQLAARAAEAKQAGEAAGVCVSWTGLAEDRMKDAEGVLRELGLGERWKRPTVDAFVLYIPPLRNKAEADKKLAEVQGLGVSEGRVIEEAGKFRWAVWFGEFPSEEGATVALNQLKEKGVRSARIAAQPKPGAALRIEQVEPAQHAALQQRQSDFPGSVVTPVDCAAP